MVHPFPITIILVKCSLLYNILLHVYSKTNEQVLWTWIVIVYPIIVGAWGSIYCCTITRQKEKSVWINWSWYTKWSRESIHIHHTRDSVLPGIKIHILHENAIFGLESGELKLFFWPLQLWKRFSFIWVELLVY